MVALIDRLATVLDELAGLEDPELADADLVVGLSAAASRLEAVVCRQSAAFGSSSVWVDAGAQNPAAWITTRCRVDRARARRRVRVGRMLRYMRLVDGSFAAGRITVEHVEALAKARDRSKATAVAFDRDQTLLVAWAESLSFVPFAKRLAEWVRVADEAAAEADAAAKHERRRLHLSQSFEDQWFLDAQLDPIGGEIVGATLRAISDELFDADWKDATAQLDGEKPTGEQLAQLTRTAAQRRADALVEMATRARTAPKDGRRPKPLFTVLVGEESFARTIELASGASTTPGRLATWLDDACFERIVFDGPSRVLDVGEQREFRGAVRRAVEVVGRTCCSEFCDVPAEQCEVDHVHPDSMGGATVQENGRLWCPFHHRFHHAENHPGFRIPATRATR